MMKSALALVEHGTWTLIGMFIFFILFSVMVYRTFVMNQQAVDELAALPLRDEKDTL